MVLSLPLPLSLSLPLPVHLLWLSPFPRPPHSTVQRFEVVTGGGLQPQKVCVTGVPRLCLCAVSVKDPGLDC